MGTLGILTCEILELEFAALLANDNEVERVTILEDDHSACLIDALRSRAFRNLQLTPQIEQFASDATAKFEVLVHVLELALHNRKKTLQEGLVLAANAMSPYVDALFLGYGLCGNTWRSGRCH